MSRAFTVKTASGNDADDEGTSPTDMAGKEFPVAQNTAWTDTTDEENIWDESKLKLIEYSLRSVRNDTINIRNDKYMQKEADDGGFGASADAVSGVETSTDEDIVGSGSEDEKFVIKGGLRTGDSLTRIEKCIKDANVDCDSASDKLESKIFDWKKTKTGYDALGNAWDSTVNFLKHPWTSMHTESIQSVDTKMEPNEVVPDGVNLTRNKTSTAWENTTHFMPGIANTESQNNEMGANIFEAFGGYTGSTGSRNQDLQAI